MTSRKTATKRKASSRDDASKRKPGKPRGKRPAAEPPAPFDPVTAYARDAVDGKVLVNKWVRLACERHLRDLEREDLVWDLEACNRVIAFFRVVLRLNAGEFEGQPFVLQPWQAFIVGSLFGWKGLDGWRRFRVAYIEIAKGNGKALALDTVLPTPAGWTTMGAIRPGDQVFDETGRPCTVTGVSDVMVGRDCFRVEFSDGCHVVADRDHLWQTRAQRTGGARGPKPRHLPRRSEAAIRTTGEMALTLEVPPSPSQHPQARWNHRIECTRPIELPPANLPIEPYGLGVWLGDGDSDCGRLTLADQDAAELIDRLSAEGWRVGPRSRHGHGASGRYLLPGLRPSLRRLGLLGAKHIPPAYLRASLEQRLALFRGLMDTDGYVGDRGQCEFTTTTPALRDGFLELARTLGFKPRVLTGRAMLRGRDCGEKYRVTFGAHASQAPFALSRKAARLRPAPVRRPICRGRAVVACRPVDSVPVRCISVDSPSRLYLAGRGMVPTHNSPMAAGTGLYMLTADGESRAQVFAAARTKDQAMVLFRDAVAMVEQSPQLKRRLKQSGLAPNVWSLAHLESRSFFRSVSSEDGKSGPTPHCALVDELHEHSDATVVDMLRAGTKSRRQALIVETTNSGFDRHSVCGQHRDHSEKVLEGIFDDDGRFAYVCGLDDGDDWLDERVWPKANPNLGISIQPKYLRELVREAEISPAKQNTVKRLNFCIWTQQSTRSIDMADWGRPAACAPIDPESLRGRRCFAGLDLARIRDLSALGLVFPPVEQDELWKVLMYYWVPEDDILQRSKRDHVPYDVWARQGLVRTTPGNTTDFDFIHADIVGVEAREGFPRREGISEVYVIEELAFDRVFAGELVIKLADAGLSMVEFGQGFLSMAEPCAAFHRMVRAGELQHGDHQVLTWNVSNLAVKTDPAGNMKPDKEKSIERIDGVVALHMALGRALRKQGRPKWDGTVTRLQ